MNNLAVIVMLAGYVWGVAGLLAYPGLSWKPGAVIVIATALWLLQHDAMPPEPYIEAGAILIFIALSFARGRLYPPDRTDKTESK